MTYWKKNAGDLACWNEGRILYQAFKVECGRAWGTVQWAISQAHLDGIQSCWLRNDFAIFHQLSEKHQGTPPNVCWQRIGKLFWNDSRDKSFYLFENFSLNMTLINGEFTESCHSTLRKSEETHGLKVVRKLGTPIHQQRSLASKTFFNFKRAGHVTPLRLRKKNQSPSGSP